ncbi:hypothetical protein QTP88_007343 [Uroleucon formosanum]
MGLIEEFGNGLLPIVVMGGYALPPIVSFRLVASNEFCLSPSRIVNDVTQHQFDIMGLIEEFGNGLLPIVVMGGYALPPIVSFRLVASNEFCLSPSRIVNDVTQHQFGKTVYF